MTPNMVNSSTSPSGSTGVTPQARLPLDGRELNQFLSISIDASQIRSDFRKEALGYKKRMHEYTQACKDADRFELYITHEFIPSRLKHNPMCTNSEVIRNHLEIQKAKALEKIRELAPSLKHEANSEQLQLEWFQKCKETILKNTYIPDLTLNQFKILLPSDVIQVLEEEAQKSVAQISTRKNKTLAALTQSHRKTKKFILDTQSKDVSNAMEDTVEGNDTETTTLVRTHQLKFVELEKKMRREANKLKRELREMKKKYEDLSKSNKRTPVPKKQDWSRAKGPALRYHEPKKGTATSRDSRSRQEKTGKMQKTKQKKQNPLARRNF